MGAVIFPERITLGPQGELLQFSQQTSSEISAQALSSVGEYRIRDLLREKILNMGRVLYSMLSMLSNKKYNHTLKWMGAFKHVISVLLILTGLHSPFIAYLSIGDSIEDSTLKDFNFMKTDERVYTQPQLHVS